MARQGKITITEAEKLVTEAKLLGSTTGHIIPFWCGAYYDPLTNILCLLHPNCHTADAQLAFIMSHADLVPVLVDGLPKSRVNRDFWQLRGNLVIDPGEV